MTPSDPSIDDFRQRFGVVEGLARSSIGVESLEDHLIELTDHLESMEHPIAVQGLTELATQWPRGAVEALEFSMRRLRWAEIQEVLEQQAESNPDFRFRNLSRQVLEVYQTNWPAGEIYRTYR